MSNQKKKSVCITDAEQELLNFFRSGEEAVEFKDNLMRVHDIVIYDSSIPIDAKEKTALFKTKMLADAIFKLKENNPVA